jgi:hypothetical protein
MHSPCLPDPVQGRLDDGRVGDVGDARDLEIAPALGDGLALRDGDCRIASGSSNRLEGSDIGQVSGEPGCCARADKARRSGRIPGHSPIEGEQT